ncbi:hypothetical protein AciX8_2586 [Granulicella mallensis MP5ACTX8]|uniref:Capsule assembly protein Wzi n=1 Tax=Granulicella mallensis (strain ATCC BAA-1857 / DSM 23137 / MP5ACTX8) TaxID=682795 RepID=G8P0A2_GRAMM|nr:hypothetical protein AciX8_2586 [Granulicella mallensis MP5ACTX8]
MSLSSIARSASLFCVVVVAQVYMPMIGAQESSPAEFSARYIPIAATVPEFRASSVSSDGSEHPTAVLAARSSIEAGNSRQESFDGDKSKEALGSAYIPVDSWIYPALLRLYSLGYLDTAFLSMRPWTNRSVLHMLDETEDSVRLNGSDEAKEIFAKVKKELQRDPSFEAVPSSGLVYGLNSGYIGVRQIAGPVLRDSFHLGQSFINDYGRPYSTGFNSYDGFSAIAERGRFSLYVRGEYQHAPHYDGYSFALAQSLSIADRIPYSGFNLQQSTIPEGVLPSQNNFRLLEANVSGHLVGHEISFGKSDAWLGPGLGGAMAWSNNAEDMYTFRINRVEPLNIPWVSRVLGPIRYDFFIGSLKGHTDPNSPWAHSEMFSFAPTSDFQFGFQRTIIFGGEGHAPVTLHTFLKGFFDINDTDLATKFSRFDPGARFSTFNFSYRLPFLRKSVTLYTDSTTHDDVTPISAPRRAGWRPGIYFSHLPYAPKLDLRIEGVYTDYPTLRSQGGEGNYDEQIEVQGYTNKGFIMGDWIGREAKGGQAWLTYHLSGNEFISLQYLNKKNAKDFIPSGTTQNTFRLDITKRIRPDIELSAYIQNERWKAPIYKSGLQSDTTGSFQVAWYPKLINKTP